VTDILSKTQKHKTRNMVK